MKKTLALLLALVMAFSMFSVVAFADNSATINVALVDDEGNAVTGIKAGESVWAVISVANYANYVGEMEINRDADDIATDSTYDKVISVVTTYLELDTENFNVATDDNGLVWESPYKTDIADQGGEMQYNLDGNVLKTLLQTDCEGGVYYSIGKAELDANNGELYRVKLIAASDAALGDYTVALNGGDGITAPGIATISSAAGDANITTADVPVALGAAANIEIYSGDVVVDETDSYTIVDATEGFVYDEWTAVSPVAPTIKEDAAQGGYTFKCTDPSQRVDVTYDGAFYFDDADVRVDGLISYVRYSDNNLPKDAPAVYGGVALGGLEFRMEQHVIPQIWYNGEKIAQGDALIPTYHVMGEDGEFAVDAEGNKIVATDAEGAPLYANWGAYINAVKIGLVGYNDFNFAYTLEVEDGVVYGYITYKNTNNATVTTDALTVALPEGAFAEAVKPAVITAGTAHVETTVNAAKVTATKVVVDVDAEVIIDNNADFSAADWTIVKGTTGSTEARQNTKIAADGSYIQLGTKNGDVIVKNNKTFTGSDFYIEYIAKTQVYCGNDVATAERFGVRVGDFYFCLNNGGIYPYVEFAGQPVYQATEPIWTLVGATEALQAEMNALSTLQKVDMWGQKGGSNPTYRISLKDNKLTVTYQTSNYAETVIVPEMTVNFGTFRKADVSLAANAASDWAGYEQYTKFYMDNASAMKKVDIGRLNAQMDAFVDRGDYANVPEYIKTVAAIGNALTDIHKKTLTEANIAKAKAFAEMADAYAILGTIEINDYLVKNFSAGDWTTNKCLTKNNATYGDYLVGTDKDGNEGTDIEATTKNTFNLDEEFHLFTSYGKKFYNTNRGYNVTIKVGDIAVKVEPTTYGTSLDGTTLVTVSNGDAVVGTGTGGSYKSTSDFATAAGAAADRYITIAIDYVDGVLKVTTGGTVAFEGAVEADLTAATVTFDESKMGGWSVSYAYDFYLYASTTEVNLFELNEEMGKLANISNWKNYSEIAATADAVLSQITDEDMLAVMYNIPVYEAYKEAYAIAKNGATYKLINGLYAEDWTYTSTTGTSDYWVRGTKEIKAASYENGDKKPAVVATIPGDGKGIYFYNGKGTMNATSKLPLATAGYFKIDYRYDYYFRGSYIQWKIGDLTICVANDTDSDAIDIEGYNGVYVDVIYDGELIHRITGTSNKFGWAKAIDGTDGWAYANCPFTITYDNGILGVTYNNWGTKYITPKEGLDLTTIEGFDANYDPNGNNVELEMAIDYNTSAFYNVAVTGRFNKDAVAALDELAATDAAAAKNIFDTLSKTDGVTAATKALLSKTFNISAEETVTYTYTVDGHNTDAYRYGDTITLVGDDTVGYDFAGWYDAEGNLLSEAETYSVKVEPGVTIIAKGKEGCYHPNVSPTEDVDATCGTDGKTGEFICDDCGEIAIEGTVIPATGEHEWGEWKITTPATSTAAGIKTRTCGICGVTDTMKYTVETSGTSGDVTWRLENGTLYIEGTGEMDNYVNAGEGVAPWQALRTEITSIIIGDGVTRLGNRAFKNLNKAKTVVFGNNVTTMGYECFQGCTQLASVTLSNVLTHIGAHAFYDCAFETISIPDTVTNIENRAFKNCKKLKSIVIPNTVTKTGYELFMGCTSLTSATISTSMNMIAPHTFQGCTSLTSIYVPSNIFRIRSKAFADCTSLETVTFEDDDKLYGSSTEASIASESFLNCPETLTFKGWMYGTVSVYASRRGFQFEATNTSEFKYTLDADNNATITGMRGEISKADIPETVDGYTVVAIGTAAFRDNTFITRVTIPATVKTIAGRAFQGCTALTTVEGLENVTSLAYSAFQNCSALTGELYVPETVVLGNASAFTGCTGITIKTQANSSAAKAAASNGIAVKIVTNFDYEVNVDGESVTVTGVLGDVTELVIPDEINGLKVTAIKQRAFKNNTTLTSVVIGDNVTELLYETFMNCTNIKTVVVGAGVTATGSSTFGGMTGLESITFNSENISFHTNTFKNSNANMTVYGVAGSSVQTFVEKKGLTFVAL